MMKFIMVLSMSVTLCVGVCGAEPALPRTLSEACQPVEIPNTYLTTRPVTCAPMPQVNVLPSTLPVPIPNAGSLSQLSVSVQYLAIESKALTLPTNEDGLKEFRRTRDAVNGALLAPASRPSWLPSLK
jgi:hypothetical protein